jgi:hypothetical protein
MLCIYATREVQADEELLIMYDVDELLFWPNNVRKQALQDRYGFECTCRNCDASTINNSPLRMRRGALASQIRVINAYLDVPASVSIQSTYIDVLGLIASLGLETWEKAKL